MFRFDDGLVLLMIWLGFGKMIFCCECEFIIVGNGWEFCGLCGFKLLCRVVLCGFKF